MEKQEYEQELKANRLFHHLDPEELELLLTQAKPITFKPQQWIIKQGNKSKGIYIILEGKVNISGRILGEGMLHLATLSKGNILGSSSLISDGPSATSAIAETAVLCLLISHELFQSLSVFYPEMKHKIMKESILNTGLRLQILAEKIKENMSSQTRGTRSFFSEIVKSLTRSMEVSYQEAGLDLHLLRKLPPLSILTQGENEFLNMAKLIKAPNQCGLISEEDSEAACYLVLKGAVQSSLIKQNKVAKISILGPMSFFCSFYFVAELPSFINYTTCERALLLKLDKSSFESLKNKDRAVWYRLYDLLCASIVLQARSLERLDIRINSEIYNR